jgi:Fic-DOC domain mobile mystery protein B
VTDLFQEPDDATPLEAGERDGLLQTWITTRADLNLAEEENIVKGAVWGRRRRSGTPNDILAEDFTRTLHERMFGDVWKWAGKYRQTERNIGISAARIPAEMPMMFDDIRYWVDNNTFPADEIAIRLHHRLVVIHPFPNGNGRHARLMADLLVERLGGRAFTWGGGSLANVGELRTKYISVLRKADGNAIEPLVAFARS